MIYFVLYFLSFLFCGLNLLGKRVFAKLCIRLRLGGMLRPEGQELARYIEQDRP